MAQRAERTGFALDTDHCSFVQYHLKINYKIKSHRCAPIEQLEQKDEIGRKASPPWVRLAELR